MKLPNPFKPPLAPPNFAQGQQVPEGSASWLSKLVFQWLVPFLDAGFSRPLEKDDLWELPPAQLTATTTDAVEAHFFARCEPEKRPRFMQEKPSDVVSLSSSATKNDENAAGNKQTYNEEKAAPTSGKKPKYDSSLFLALHRTFFLRIWIAGILKLFGGETRSLFPSKVSNLLAREDTLKTTTPLLTKVLLAWLTDSYIYHRLSDAQKASGEIKQPQGIGYGIGLAVGLFAMQEVSSLMTNHYFQTSLTTGLLVRTGIIGNVFRKSLRMSGRAKSEHSTGQITTMISTDASRLDRFAAFGHKLSLELDYLSALCVPTSKKLPVFSHGVPSSDILHSSDLGSVLILGFPIQFILVKIMFSQRQKGVEITDKRVRLTTEVLQGIRLIKFYAWEAFYINQIGDLRTREIATIRKSSYISSPGFSSLGFILTALFAYRISRAVLIAIVTFIPILASILSFITYALSGHDLNVAIIFSALQLFNIIRTPLIFFPFVLSSLTDALVALRRISAFLLSEELAEPYLLDYTRKTAVSVDGDFAWETAGKVDSADADKGGKGGKAKKGEKTHKKGSKGSVLPTRVDPDAVAKEEKGGEKPFELRNLKFSVPKGAFVAIVGRVGSGKSSVLQSLIGEMRRTRGEVVFSGSVAYVPQTPWIRNTTLRENVVFGQDDEEHRFWDIIRACNLERDLEMLPNGELTEIGEKGINLSGKAILDQCLLNGPLSDRTRILVTHSLHVLDKTDYIYVMDNGVIVEEGTYDALMQDSVVFSRLMDEYGSLEHEKETDKRDTDGKAGATSNNEDGQGLKKSDAALMQAEERNTGSVSWDVYAKYLRFAGGIVWAPIIVVLLTVVQAAQVGNTLFLGFWTAGSIPGFRQGDYMAVYVGFGVAQAIFSFILSFAFALAGLIASLNLFKAALTSVLRSPTAFFDTTPVGRILSRLSKDQDTLDSELAFTLWQFLSTFSSVLGTVALVFYTFPYLGIIFVPMTILYYLISVYYRRTSVETKRLDSLMRSTLYGSYSETLTGLSTIRAYRAQESAIKRADEGLDLENRAYYMTISIQRWLAVRLDMFGNTLIFGIALFAAGFRNTVDPSKIGVVLSYTLGTEMIAQFAQNEQNMNAVERVLHYSELPAEGDTSTPNDPPMSWPSKGHISFGNVKFAYREGLPLVLKGVSFDLKPGEKIGIVGRTGAGKSSLLQALFRTVELQGGQIEIDGHDIRSIGLDIVRGRIALVPQDSTLFLGTLRDNLDPQGLRTDAELISVLQRAWLLPSDGSSDPAAEAKFSLDSTVGDEGANFSVGEKQLLALCRALVKNSRIIILDEATTYYDRVLVMDAGEVAEFDTVLNLYDNEQSIFRSLCNEANLQRADILRIRADHSKTIDHP
ncbi:hypothetical protein DXG03_006336 [Asterophora parasitica]|uniref:Uncharacterized protein n=1 Tax=Asterophora parasitica TaxID=117018 RepID=A0A9P7G8C3_9AGAR|nr:hypothetical protein DXG03_006336 [Asterophora parasitica]